MNRIRPKLGTLHIANWYPNPWDSIEGNFVQDQIRVFKKEQPAEVVVVQVRETEGRMPRLAIRCLADGARGYFLLAPLRVGKVTEALSVLLLVFVLLREKAWRFQVLHFHIAYPLLLHAQVWRWLLRQPVVISEHWSAYHYNFYLPAESKALRTLRTPLQQGDPVFAVSKALLDDLQRFAQNKKFKGTVIANVVPLHGAPIAANHREVPVLFTVNRWAPIKNPLPMLAGLNRAAEAGEKFSLVIGGFGAMIEEMTAYLEKSALHDRTNFIGKMDKDQIAAQLARSDGYLFSSNYETFSVACAEALGAGLPLIGPFIPAIAEYAGPDDWEQVFERTEEGWAAAVVRFLTRQKTAGWDRISIAERAASRFSEAALRERYRQAMNAVRVNHARS